MFLVEGGDALNAFGEVEVVPCGAVAVVCCAGRRGVVMEVEGAEEGLAGRGGDAGRRGDFRVIEDAVVGCVAEVI